MLPPAPTSYYYTCDSLQENGPSIASDFHDFLLHQVLGSLLTAVKRGLLSMLSRGHASAGYVAHTESESLNDSMFSLIIWKSRDNYIDKTQKSGQLQMTESGIQKTPGGYASHHSVTVGHCLPSVTSEKELTPDLTPLPSPPEKKPPGRSPLASLHTHVSMHSATNSRVSLVQTDLLLIALAMAEAIP